MATFILHFFGENYFVLFLKSHSWRRFPRRPFLPKLTAHDVALTSFTAGISESRKIMFVRMCEIYLQGLVEWSAFVFLRIKRQVERVVSPFTSSGRGLRMALAFDTNCHCPLSHAIKFGSAYNTCAISLIKWNSFCDIHPEVTEWSVLRRTWKSTH